MDCKLFAVHFFLGFAKKLQNNIFMNERGSLYLAILK